MRAEGGCLSIHIAGVLGLVLVFILGTWRPVNLGALGLVMAFVLGTAFVHEPLRDIYSGFPVDLFVLLTGVTYLFAVASHNGTIARVVEAATAPAAGRRRLVPWIVFATASLPAMAGALGSAGVALLAPLALRLAERSGIDRRLMGLMVVHGAAAGNFSPLNPLGALVIQATARNGVPFSSALLFVANIVYNVLLAGVIVFVFGRGRHVEMAPPLVQRRESFRIEQLCTIGAILAVAVAALGFDLHIGFLAIGAAVLLQLLFPASGRGAEKHIAWGVVLLVCGIVTYVAALQRYGTVDAAGTAMSSLGSPLLSALLLCAIGALTSAFASSAGIIGAMIPLALPVIALGGIDATGLIIALALSATVVDGMPFSTVGALIVANATDDERPFVYRGLLWWGVGMIITAPLMTWLLFIVVLS
jgi:di/tricarboxylate transporter